MKIPGSFDGQRFDDMRLIHLGIPIILWYAHNRLFADIVKCNSGEIIRTSVWLKNGIKHEWRRNRAWEVTERDRNGSKLRSYPVRIPEVPEAWARRFSNPTPEEIYALIKRMGSAV